MLTQETVRRAAPPGFTPSQWATFEREGMLVVPQALNAHEVESYLEVARRCIARPRHDNGSTDKVVNAITLDPLLTSLIDHPRHVGFAYDLYGEQLRLTQADLFCRPTRGVINKWHVDGPRVVPYRVFSPVLPLKLRIGYWLTDLPTTDMGNLVYLPGSHRGEYDREHTGHDDLPGQQVLCVPAGTITIAHASLWHRVQANASPHARINLFLSYAPSWITGYYSYNDQWVAGLTREQRTILRAYDGDKEAFSRPPASELPLFTDDWDHHAATPETEIHKIRRRTRYERNLRGQL